MVRTKADLIAGAAAGTGLSQTVVRRAVNAFIDEILDAVRDGDEVRMRDFVTFGTRVLKARTYKAPIGVAVTMPARMVPRLRASRRLRDAADGW